MPELTWLLKDDNTDFLKGYRDWVSARFAEPYRNHDLIVKAIYGDKLVHKLLNALENFEDSGYELGDISSEDFVLASETYERIVNRYMDVIAGSAKVVRVRNSEMVTLPGTFYEVVLGIRNKPYAVSDYMAILTRIVYYTLTDKGFEREFKRVMSEAFAQHFLT